MVPYIFKPGKICIIIFLAVITNAWTANYVSTGNDTWAGAGFPNPLPAGDVVTIAAGHTITLNKNLVIDGTVIIAAGAVLDGSKQVEVNGVINNSGTIDISQGFDIMGTVNNSGTLTVNNIILNGSLSNSNTVTLGTNQTFLNQGGLIDGGGTLYTAKMRVESGNGNPGRSNNTVFCNLDSQNPAAPEFVGDVKENDFINNLKPTQSLIDDQVTFCSQNTAQIELLDMELKKIRKH